MPSRDHKPAADSVPAQLLFPGGVQKCCLISLHKLHEAATHLSERCAGSDGSRNTFYLSTPGQMDEPPPNRQTLCGWRGQAAHINILSKSSSSRHCGQTHVVHNDCFFSKWAQIRQLSNAQDRPLHKKVMSFSNPFHRSPGSPYKFSKVVWLSLASGPWHRLWRPLSGFDE